jgi:predicted phosphate transport protein (TIGR00153 family)
MLRRLLPKKDIFFQFMEQQVAKAAEAVAALHDLFEDLANVEAHRDRVKAIEHEADQIAHRAIAHLHKTFITPMDRNDINKMTKRLDDIVDLVEGAAQRMFHYELKTYPEPARRLVELLQKQIACLQTIVGHLSDLRQRDAISKAIVDINRYENEADDILRPAIADLFRREADARQIIKWKEVYEKLENATDRCEDIADMAENILLEYA